MFSHRGFFAMLALVGALLGCGPSERASIAAHKNRIRKISFAPNGKTLVSGGEDGTVKIWDAGNWKLIRSIEPNFNKPAHVMAVAYSPDGSKLGIGRHAAPFRLHNDSGKELIRLGGDQVNVWDLAFSPDGKLIATVTRKLLTLWDTETGVSVKSFEVSNNQLWCVTFSPDGQSVASGGFEGTVVRISDVERGAVARSFNVKHGCVTSLAYFCDGNTLAVGGDFIWLIDPSNGQEKAVLRGHTSGSRSIAISADEMRLVSAGAAGDVRVWDLNTKRLLATYWGSPREELWSIALSPDGKTIVSGSDKGSLKVWDMVK
jgi:WD40 repeat protein